ncbi:hypothetical protein BMI85_15710 [Thioclava sp. DLFJ4-1]|nr:hypothetical protein BMI89_20260 [Thioclava sp. F36-7]OOY15375.1 hypothetical protein BMI85_15710 [Thioclava sp. DLFJ4-1]
MKYHAQSRGTGCRHPQDGIDSFIDIRQCVDAQDLRGHNPTRYTVHKNDPWCITFEFHDGDAYVLD